jgi:hypothetical protein
MKNIHILPTEKPSRIFYLAGNLHLEMGQLITPKDYQNIYITSDMEEIKEGDYYIAEFGSLDRPIHKHIGEEPKGDYKKIILTTDQDLDGVQAIDDDFLEWFVTNPSCEFVEVVIMNKEYNKTEDFPYQECYKIIIPQEEPKQDYSKIKEGLKKSIEGKAHFIQHFKNGGTVEEFKPLEPKQEIELVNGFLPTSVFDKKETLEEAAEIFVNNRFSKQISGDKTYPDIYASKEAIVESHILFSKWQQERMYSEEEVKEIIKLSCEKGMLIQRTINDEVKIPYTRIKDFTIKMLEQFKKK